MPAGKTREEIRAGVTGPVSSIRTPFLRDGSIDLDGLRRFIDLATAGGAGSVLFTPGDSLFSIMSDEEIAEVTKVGMKHTAGRAMFIASTGFWHTAKAVEFARHVKDLGADALIAAPPVWGGISPEALVAYYRTVSEEIPVFMLTGSLSSLGVDPAIEVVKMVLDEVENVVGAKEDYCPEFAERMCREAHGRWAIFAGGRKKTHMDMLPHGCDGYMSTFVILNPDITRQYWGAVEADDIEKAKDIIAKYDDPFFEALMSFPEGWNAGMHACLELAGVCGRWRRDPYRDLDDEGMQRLARLMESLRLPLRC